MIDYTKILTRKYPGASWTLNGDNYEGLTWLDESTKPTQNELDALWPEVKAEIEAEIEAKESQRLATSQKLEALGITLDELNVAISS